MKYIASLSFGKDSLAQIILIRKLGLPLDEVIYCDVRYTPDVSGEMPEMAEFIPKAEIILKKEFGVTVRHLTAQKGFKEWFYTKKVRGKRIGTIYGFPFVCGAWCNDRLKVGVIEKYLNSISDNTTEYIGIAYDEPKRYERLLQKSNDNHIKRSILFETKTTEAQAFEICKKFGLVSPIYKTGLTRGGCWFCVKQNKASLRHIWKNHPNLWAELCVLEKESPYPFKEGLTLAERATQFKVEEMQQSLFNDEEGNNGNL